MSSKQSSLAASSKSPDACRCVNVHTSLVTPTCSPSPWMITSCSPRRFAAPPVYEMSVVGHAPRSSVARVTALADAAPPTRAAIGPVSKVDSPQARPTEQSTGVTVYLRSFVVTPERLHVMTPSARLPPSEMALIAPFGTDSSTFRVEPAPGMIAERVASTDSPDPKVAFDRLRVTFGGGL